MIINPARFDNPVSRYETRDLYSSIYGESADIMTEILYSAPREMLLISRLAALIAEHGILRRSSIDMDIDSELEFENIFPDDFPDGFHSKSLREKMEEFKSDEDYEEDEFDEETLEMFRGLLREHLSEEVF